MLTITPADSAWLAAQRIDQPATPVRVALRVVRRALAVVGTFAISFALVGVFVVGALSVFVPVLDVVAGWLVAVLHPVIATVSAAVSWWLS